MAYLFRGEYLNMSNRVQRVPKQLDKPFYKPYSLDEIMDKVIKGWEKMSETQLLVQIFDRHACSYDGAQDKGCHVFLQVRDIVEMVASEQCKRLILSPWVDTISVHKDQMHAMLHICTLLLVRKDVYFRKLESVCILIQFCATLF